MGEVRLRVTWEPLEQAVDRFWRHWYRGGISESLRAFIRVGGYSCRSSVTGLRAKNGGLTVTRRAVTTVTAVTAVTAVEGMRKRRRREPPEQCPVRRRGARYSPEARDTKFQA